MKCTNSRIQKKNENDHENENHQTRANREKFQRKNWRVYQLNR